MANQELHGGTCAEQARHEASRLEVLLEIVPTLLITACKEALFDLALRGMVPHRSRRGATRVPDAIARLSGHRVARAGACDSQLVHARWHLAVQVGHTRVQLS